MGLQIQTGFAYRLTALTALTMPPEPRLGRTFPDRERSKVTGPRLEAMIRERSENNSRTKRRNRAARFRVVSA
jgi:hypothetical protein